MHNQHNYNIDFTGFDKFIHSIADSMIKRDIHPNYIKIGKVLKIDNIKTDQCFTDKYHDLKGFLKVYNNEF